MRHALCLPAVAAALVLVASASVQAMPLAADLNSLDSAVTTIADGCGPFGHRSHYGYCKEDGYGGGDYDRGGYGGGYRREGAQGFYGDSGYRERRCFVRETYDGPRRFCR